MWGFQLTQTLKLDSPIVNETKCPVKININSQNVDIPNVSMIAQVPSQGIELMPIEVTNDYENNKTYARFGIRKIPTVQGSPVTLTQANLTLWGQFLAWLGIVQTHN